ncbi:hypothetical protein [Devosia sp. Root105]|uniref:hypothetical protein n=1 Tax=Devosia sp. Root105 TaxID=1736423 RepID=UPI0006F4F3E4|nr:hypothetical protein [Devosia sp. Root105]KQU95212.1 hypothetical protein ASC68_18850 [Devosia sp. Root105]
MHQLFYPLRYFRLVNKQKRFIDLIPTIIIAILIWAPFAFLDANFFGGGGFLDKVLPFTGALTGFYIAALVAAATFNSPDLDKVIRSGPIALITKDDDGKQVQSALSRREFTCIMFGFLAFSSMAITLTGAMAVVLAQPIVTAFAGSSATLIFWLGAGAKLAVCLWVAHLFVVTALGLYYLMDRLYRQDGHIISRKDDDKKAA